MNAYIKESLDFLKEKTEDSSIKPSNEYRIKTVKVMYYWLFGEINHLERNTYYREALKLLSKLYNENPTDIRLYFASIYLNIKIEEYDEAYEILKILLKNKNTMKLLIR